MADNNQNLGEQAIILFKDLFDKRKEYIEAILNSDELNDVMRNIAVVKHLHSIYKFVKSFCGIKDKIYLNKIEQFFKDHSSINIDSRNKYLSSLTKEDFIKYSNFIFEIIDKTEEGEKIKYYSQLCSALYDNVIDKGEFRRYIIMTKNTPYVDLLYIEQNICSGVFELWGENEESLLSYGWIMLFPYGHIIDDRTKMTKSSSYKYTNTAINYCKIVFKKSEIPEKKKHEKAMMRLC